jgi:hypothetical protein
MTTAILANIVLQMLAAGLGGYCLLLWFKKARKPVFIGYHLLAGLGATETLFVIIHISGFPAESFPRTIGLAAGMCFGAAILSGFISALIGKHSPPLANTLLAVHVTSAVAGLIMALVFAHAAWTA